MHDTHNEPYASGGDTLALSSQPGTALLPWHSSPRLAFEQLSFATTEGALALAEAPLAPPAQRVVLIAESDPVLARALQDELGALSGWQTLLVSDGPRAGDLIAQTRPRVVLLDIELTGVDVYSQLRAHPASRDTHIIFLTSATSYDLYQLGVREGVLLRKPYDPRDLAGIVRVLLDA
jgi:CheY-like chemotaxis protein